MNPDIFVAVGAAMVAMLLAVTLREIKKDMPYCFHCSVQSL